MRRAGSQKWPYDRERKNRGSESPSDRSLMDSDLWWHHYRRKEHDGQSFGRNHRSLKSIMRRSPPDGKLIATANEHSSLVKIWYKSKFTERYCCLASIDALQTYIDVEMINQIIIMWASYRLRFIYLTHPQPVSSLSWRKGQPTEVGYFLERDQ